MHIVVCIKQVPDSAQIRVHPVTNTIMRQGVPTIINPYDLFALEEALRLRDKLGGEVTVLTMGPPTAEDSLRKALTIGANRAVLLTDRFFAGSDTLATSYALAAAIRKIGSTFGAVDVVFTGKQTIDGDTAQVGPQIGEKLGLPQVTYAADIQKTGDTVTVKRMLEDGYMTIKVKTPCLLTCIKELNAPRYMSVGGIFEAYGKPLATFDYETLKDDALIDPSTIGLKGSPTNILTSFTPPLKGAGMMLEGADKEACEKLVGILSAKHII